MDFEKLKEADIELLYNDILENKDNRIGCICYCNNVNIGDVVVGYGCWGPNGYNYTCGSLCTNTCSYYLYGSANRGICSFTCDSNYSWQYIDPKAYCYL